MNAQATVVQVLTDRSLFDSIVAFTPGVPYFALCVKHKLKCAQLNVEPPVSAAYTDPVAADGEEPIDRASEDIRLWRNAVRNGDKRTLEALHLLAMIDSPLGVRVRAALTGIFGVVVLRARDSADTTLLEWVDSKALFKFDSLRLVVTHKLGRQGALEMLRWLHEHGYHINYAAASGAATSGNLDVLRFIESVGPEKATIDGNAVIDAAVNGHIHVLEFLMNQREWNLVGWMPSAYSLAVGGGNLSAVRYLHEKGYSQHIDGSIDSAAENGHIDVVRYMYENGIGRCSEKGLTGAAKNGHLDVVQYLCAAGAEDADTGTFTEVVKNGRFDILKALCTSQIDFAVVKALAAAVKLGKLEFVRFLYELDPASCVHDEGYLTADAAEYGYLDIIKFFHECGDPRLFDWRAMHGAAIHGHLDIVKFLHEHRDEGCRYFTLVYVYENGHHHVLDFLCEYRPMEQAKRQAGWERKAGRPGLADKIERGAAVAKRAKRKVYSFQ